MNITLFLQSILSGVLMGGIYALLSVGFSLTWGVMRIINIAHASFGVVAAYGAYWALTLLKLDPLFSLVPIVMLLFFLGVVLHRAVMQPITRAKEIVVASMVLTFGLAIIVENTMLVIWSPDPRALTPSYAGKAILIGELGLPLPQLIGFALAIVGVTSIHLFLHHTHTGKAVQATWQDPEGAALVGINLQRVSRITFGLALASAGAGGIAMAMMYTFDPAMHNIWLIYLFLIVIVGGVGSVLGTAVAGMLIGVVTGLCMALLPYHWINAITFGFLMVVLLLRPQGIFKTGV